MECQHITPDEFLSCLMRNESQAGFEEFLALWHSSENLRRMIRQALAGEVHASTEKNNASSQRAASSKPSPTKSKQGKIVESMITQGLVSAPTWEEKIAQPYGGLSRKQLLVLLDQFKAGKRSLGTYMLIREWKRHSANPDSMPDVRLKRLTLDCFSRAIEENKADFFNDIADTIRFLQEEEYRDNGRWNHDPGQWWQFHLLLYILEHPKEKYAMREFVRNFKDEVGSNEMPTTKTIRSFCRRHGIVLDSSPGAPKKSKDRAD